MSGTAVLLCRDAAVTTEPGWGVPVATVDQLCERPEAAASALRRLEADRVVLGLCDRRASSELLAALRRAGAAPFSIEAVTLRGREPGEAAAIVAGAVAKLDALMPGERGRPVAVAGTVSRRALFSFSGVVEHAPVAALDPSVCAGAAACGLCLDACPEHAIAIDGSRPAIDASACTACGACVPRCPHGALRLTGSATAQSEAQLDALLGGGVGRIAIACANGQRVAPPGWALVELPTLALVTAGWILQLRARGAEVRLWPCEEECCAGVPEVQALADRLSTRRPALGAGPRAPVRLREPAATSEGTVLIGPRDAAAPIEARVSPLGVLTLDPDRCTVCGACASACPTEALVLRETETGLALEHDPARCVACDRCVSVCPEHALEVMAGVEPSRLRAGTLELIASAHERCTVCGTQLPPLAMRRRVAELLGRPDAPLHLCAMCGARARPAARERDAVANPTTI